MTWFSLGPFYIQILYSFTWLLVCCWFWSHSCIVTVKLNNQTNISANQTQIFTQLNLYCMYNMCPEMCPRKWCGRKTAWKKLCCSSGICQMYSILFCKQWPMYARNISCLVLSCIHGLSNDRQPALSSPWQRFCPLAIEDVILWRRHWWWWWRSWLQQQERHLEWEKKKSMILNRNRVWTPERVSLCWVHNVLHA